MAKYEKRLQDDLAHIRGEVRAMGDMVESLLSKAVHALLTGNAKLANASVLADHPVNRKMREIDRVCHGFIARHLPSAGHLRLISSIIRINIELERVGDYAVTISREALQLERPPQGLMAQEVETIAGEVKRMLHQSLTAFYEGSADMAKATMGMSANLESTLDGIYGNLMSGEHTGSAREMFALFAVLNQLKRVADQAKNVCEETVFALTGETKANKVYNVLFVDENNAALSQMAEALARKNFPHSGNYSSAGRSPAAAVDGGMVEFMDHHGIDLSRALTKPIDFSTQELAAFHVIVSLQGAVTDYFPSVPFHTAFLEWGLPEAPGDGDPARYEEIYKELSFQLRDLMELLRGEGAD